MNESQRTSPTREQDTLPELFEHQGSGQPNTPEIIEDFTLKTNSSIRERTASRIAEAVMSTFKVVLVSFVLGSFVLLFMGVLLGNAEAALKLHKEGLGSTAQMVGVLMGAFMPIITLLLGYYLGRHSKGQN